MHKKGQIYVVAAILLSVVIFGIASITNVAKQEELKGDFERLSGNYETEGSKLINSVIDSGEEVGPRFGNFTYLFTSYSKTQNPQFGLIYIFDYKEVVYIGNYLTDPIQVEYKDATGSQILNLTGCFGSVELSVTFGDLTTSFTSNIMDLEKCVQEIPEPLDNKLFVAIRDSWYPFELIPGKPQLMVVSKMEQSEQRKVFVGGEGFLKVDNHCNGLEEAACKSLEVCIWDDDKGKCRQNEGNWGALQEGRGGKKK